MSKAEDDEDAETEEAVEAGFESVKASVGGAPLLREDSDRE